MVKYFYDKHQIAKKETIYIISNQTYAWVANHSTFYRYLNSNNFGRIQFSDQHDTGTPTNPYYTFNKTNPLSNQMYRYDTFRPNDRYWQYNFDVANKSYTEKQLEIRVSEEKGALIETVAAEDGTYPNDGIKDGFWYVRKGLANHPPTITLTTPNNATLYENGTYSIAGTAKDANSGDIVSVWYQIGNGTARAIDSKVSDGITSIDYSLQLTFKAGRFQRTDGTEVTGSLAEGTAHKLKVWSEDNQGGKSTIQERTFYVVPNRPPSLTVNPFTPQTGMIGADTVEFSGATNDPDGNDVKVTYRVNNSLPTEIYSGPAGPWSFDLALSVFKDGDNTIIVEVTDAYNFKSSKTIKFNRAVNKSALDTSVLRYQVVTINSASQVRFWVRRDPGQVLSAEVSMTNGSEPEQYNAMTLTASIPKDDGTVEDEFNYDAGDEKSNIFLKLILSGGKPVTSISGMLK